MDGHRQIERAIEILRAGGLVAFATETVYGLGADATNSQAIGKIFSIKGRPPTNPLIVHVADVSVAKKYVAAWPESADRLARMFWPGPLTLVLPKSEKIVPAVTAGLPTVGIRCPDHPLALALLRGFAGPVAAPSANRSNRLSPTTADHVRRELGDQIDLILDGGDCRVGIESTVVDLTSARPAILRPGGISRLQLEKILGSIDYNAADDSNTPAPSPGRQPVHYAPTAPAYRFDPSEFDRLEDLFSKRLGRSAVFLIIEGTEPARKLHEWHQAKRLEPGAIIKMPPTADDYARRLYGALREADDQRPHTIWVQQPPVTADWDAVRDRIHRATRPATDAR
jgi:L-threonylcarbamoyladenylate synthase